jgi:hypothetical protein
MTNAALRRALATRRTHGSCSGLTFEQIMLTEPTGPALMAWLTRNAAGAQGDAAAVVTEMIVQRTVRRHLGAPRRRPA